MCHQSLVRYRRYNTFCPFLYKESLLLMSFILMRISQFNNTHQQCLPLYMYTLKDLCTEINKIELQNNSIANNRLGNNLIYRIFFTSKAFKWKRLSVFSCEMVMTCFLKQLKNCAKDNIMTGA